MAALPVVWSDDHARHTPHVELSLGQVTSAHETPERAERIRAALAADPRFSEIPARAHGRSPIDAVHDPRLPDHLETLWQRLQDELATTPDAPTADLVEVVPEMVLHPALREGMGDVAPPSGAVASLGYWCFDTSTPFGPGTWGAARAAVDVALTAADEVLAGAPHAYGLCRPPGHHAPRSAYGGFCFLNNAAIAAAHLAATTGGRVAVLDVDYHHGNGTQQIFYERDDVLVVSLHADPERAYPYYSGFADETGAGRGWGATVNVPLAAGVDDDAYLARLGDVCATIAGHRPDVLVVSLGVDTYWNDPISDLALTAGGYDRCGRVVAGLGLPTVVLQEGGYDVAAIGANVHAWLGGLTSGA